MVIAYPHVHRRQPPIIHVNLSEGTPYPCVFTFLPHVLTHPSTFSPLLFLLELCVLFHVDPGSPLLLSMLFRRLTSLHINQIPPRVSNFKRAALLIFFHFLNKLSQAPIIHTNTLVVHSPHGAFRYLRNPHAFFSYNPHSNERNEKRQLPRSYLSVLLIRILTTTRLPPSLDLSPPHFGACRSLTPIPFRIKRNY